MIFSRRIADIVETLVLVGWFLLIRKLTPLRDMAPRGKFSRHPYSLSGCGTWSLYWDVRNHGSAG